MVKNSGTKSSNIDTVITPRYFGISLLLVRNHTIYQFPTNKGI